MIIFLTGFFIGALITVIMMAVANAASKGVK